MVTRAQLHRYFIRSMVAVVLSLYGAALSAATLEARVDKKALVIGEHLTLTLALINSDTRLRAEGVNPNIDLTVLTSHFELGIPQASHHYSPFRNRGRSSSEISVTLFPKNSGQFTIPPFSVDGEASTPLTITVHEGAADATPEVFSRSGVYKTKLWLREQTIAYIDLYHRVELASAKLGGALESEPKLQIQLSQLTQADRTEIHNGVSYNVTRSAWGVAPAIDQMIRLFLPDVWVETQAGKQLRFPFNDITIEVQPLPDNVPPLTLVGRPELTQSTLADSIAQHRNLQLELVLQAPTNIINLAQTIPTLSFPAALKTYIEGSMPQYVEGADDGSSRISYHYFIIPITAGRFQLPDWRVPYFDPERGVMDEVILQGQTIEVTPAAVPMTTSTPTPMLTLPADTIMQDHRPALPWQIATLIVTLLWLGSLLLWWYQKQARTAPTVDNHPRNALPSTSRHPLQQQLLTAFGTQTLEQGLTQWESQQDVDDEIRAIIHQVQQCCYGTQQDQNIDHLQADVTQIIDKIQKQKRSLNRNDRWSPKAFTAS